MKRRNVRVHRSTSTAIRNPVQWRLVFLTLVCAAIVAAGFFYAARQHFATMEFGLKNSKLRKQIEGLEAERRRLLLAKEVSLSPLEITRTAENLGFDEQVAAPPTAEMVKLEKPAETNTTTAEMAKAEKPAETHTPTVTYASLPVQSRSEAPKAEKPTVQKVADKPVVKPIVQQTAVKPASPDVRPRIAATDKRVADATTKPVSKLR